MKILFINQAFYPDAAATGQYLSDMAVEMAVSGHEVTVLTSRYGYANADTVYPSREIYQNVKIVRAGWVRLGRGSKSVRILDAALMNLAFCWELIWMSRFDKIVALTSPPLVGWVALLFAKFRRSKLVYWVMDIHPDIDILADWVAKGSLKARVLDWIFTRTLKGSDEIIVLDRYMKDRVLQNIRGEKTIHILPPWPHDEDIQPVPHESNPFRQKHGLNGKFVVMYSGNHSICHPLDTVLEAATILRDDANTMFVFIGGGARVKDVTDAKEKHHLSNIIQLPYQNRTDLKYSLSAADLHLIVMGDSYVGVTHPCKIYGILSLGRPFAYIGPLKSHIGDMMERAGLGCHVDHHDPGSLVAAIKQTQEMTPEALKTAADKSKALSGDRYSQKVLCGKLKSILERG